MALTAVLLRLTCTLCFLTTASCVLAPDPCMMMGSGCGSGMTPEIRDCPMQPVQVNITRPLNTDENATAMIRSYGLFTLYHPMNEPLSIEVTLKEANLLPRSLNYRIAADIADVESEFENSTGLTVALIGDFVFVTDVILSFSAVASDAMMVQSEPCNFTLSISVEDRDNCTDASSLPFSEDVDLEDPLRVYFGITITLNFPVANFDDDILRRLVEPLIDRINSRCRDNCGGCGLQATCSSYLSYCQEFSLTDVERIGQARAGARIFRRALAVTDPNITVIDVVINHPTGSPLSGVVSLVPPETAVSVLNEVAAQIMNSTGISIISTGTLVGNPDVTSTTFLARIVLPVLLILIILSLIVGLVILIVVAKTKKDKKKNSKVRPFGRSSSSSSNKGLLS